VKDTTLLLIAKTQPLNGETLPLIRAANLPSGTQTLPHIAILPVTSNTLPFDGGCTNRTLEQEEVEMDNGTCVELPNAIADSKGFPNNKMETLHNLCKPFN